MDTIDQTTLMKKFRTELLGHQYSCSFRSAPDAQDLFLWASGEIPEDLTCLTFSVMLHVVPDFVTYGKVDRVPHRTIFIGKELMYEQLDVSYIRANTRLKGSTGRIAGLLNLLKLLTVQERRNLPIKATPANIYSPTDKLGNFFITDKEIIFPIRYTNATFPTTQEVA